MSIERPRPTTCGNARRLLAALGTIALLVALPDERLAAQVPSVVDSVLARRLRERLGTQPARRCLTLRVFPGDTAASAMPRASGDSLADPRMSRRLDDRPSCDRATSPAPSRALLPTRVPFPARP